MIDSFKTGQFSMVPMKIPDIKSLRVKLFTDGADKAQIVEMARNPWISGFTTNPSLLKKAGVTDYVKYAHELVAAVPDRHISFEVVSDHIPEMIEQARLISSWGKNVYAKIPVMTTRKEYLFDTVKMLSHEGIKINMTAIFTFEQVAKAVAALDGGAPSVVSVFAGRLGDVGIDYRPIVQDAVDRANKTKTVEVIWASTREVFNIIEAHDMGCHIVTAPADVLKKMPGIGTQTGDDLTQGCVEAFRDDALAAGITLPKTGAGRAAS